MGAIGVFGGTFDPVHHGHLIIAETVAEQLQLDRLMLVPARVSPLKADRPTAPDEARLDMLRQAVADHPVLAVSRVDIDRPGPSYTVDTLEILSERHGEDLVFLMGSDALASLPRWREPGRIVELARIAHVERPGHGVDTTALSEIIPGLSTRLVRVAAPLIQISATDIRRRIASGRSIRYRVPDAVRRYIRDQELYRQTVSAAGP